MSDMLRYSKAILICYFSQAIFRYFNQYSINIISVLPLLYCCFINHHLSPRRNYMFHTNSFSDVASVEQYISTNAAANALYRSFKPDWKELVQDFFLSKRTTPQTAIRLIIINYGTKSYRYRNLIQRGHAVKG